MAKYPPLYGPRATRSSLWSDLTKDYKTGHYVFKDWTKTISFLVGVGLVLFSAYADYQAKRDINPWGATALLAYALGTGLQKTFEQQENRKTLDANGNPLAQPGTADPPGAAPKLMPTE